LEKEYDIITGTVLRKDRGNVFIDLGKLEAILGSNEQMPGEHYNFNRRIKLYIVEVKKTTKGPQIIVSRTHPGLVKRLFELEVPEIYNGVVEIKSISREAGSRSKVAVHSNDENIDPMGACVGPKGSRVQNIVDEVNNEKIDIIKWSKDPKEFISNSLSPAKVIDITITDENNKCARAVVDDSQLSLAIGREGQNVRLAAKLTGWKIDIKSKSQIEKVEAMEKVEDVD
jgi:transcription termination/antitermination protein NusA